MQRVDDFVRSAETLGPEDAEAAMYPVLSDLLSAQGFHLTRPEDARHQGPDFVGLARSDSAASTKVAVEYKHHRSDRPVGTDVVTRWPAKAAALGMDRLMLISRSGFSRGALQLASRDFPIAVELLDFDSLRDLAASVDGPVAPQASRVIALIRQMAEQLARFVAEDPRELDHLEWRDLERMMTAVFDGLGFAAELTPASKDGGKDIILSLRISGVTETFIVELKHWRSGKRVSDAVVREFVSVVAREERDGGLFLSTHGYTPDAVAALTEIDKSAVRLGETRKIVSLCRQYVRVGNGLWTPEPEGLPRLLMADTLAALGPE